MFQTIGHIFCISYLFGFMASDHAIIITEKNIKNNVQNKIVSTAREAQTSSRVNLKHPHEKRKSVSPYSSAAIKTLSYTIIPKHKPEDIKQIKERIAKAKNKILIAKQHYKKEQEKHSAPVAKKHSTLFGSIEVQRNGLKLFPKWLQVLEKNKKEHANAKTKQTEKSTTNNKNCRYDENPLCLYLDKNKYTEWNDFLVSIKNFNPEEQLSKINDYSNQNIYISDDENWRIEDYWASPGEFLRRSGDCEDYAITKYISLAELGWDVDKMRVVVLEDTNLDLIHVVLAVHMDGKIKILDNQYEMIIDEDRIKHYRPIFAVNENSWWRYH